MSQPSAATHCAHLRLDEWYRFRVRFDAGARELVTDESAPLGNGQGPAPTALLGAAVANCLASSLLFCMRKARIEVDALDADVSVGLERDEQHRLRVGRIDVELTPCISNEDRARIGRCIETFESYCVVTESVRRGIPVNVAVVPQTCTIRHEHPEPHSWG
jgi:uncharacterized OsmC-like protein